MTPHTDLIARLRVFPGPTPEAAADALESLEQQVAALTKERDAWREEASISKTSIDMLKGQLEHKYDQLDAAQADNARLRKQLIRVVGDHNPPRDCYATGPMTGNDIEDLVSCPSCEAEVLLALPIDDSALMERLKQERECVYVEMFNQGYINKQSLQQLQGA